MRPIGGWPRMSVVGDALRALGGWPAFSWVPILLPDVEGEVVATADLSIEATADLSIVATADTSVEVVAG